MKCVPKYCPVQQQQVSRPSLLCSPIAMGSLMIASHYWQSSSNGPLARQYCGSSSNGLLAVVIVSANGDGQQMSECPSLLWG
jgi:hypothetical protein